MGNTMFIKISVCFLIIHGLLSSNVICRIKFNTLFLINASQYLGFDFQENKRVGKWKDEKMTFGFYVTFYSICKAVVYLALIIYFCFIFAKSGI